MLHHLTRLLTPTLQSQQTSRTMSFVIDVWTNPPEVSLMDSVPEVAHLFDKTGVDLDTLRVRR